MTLKRCYNFLSVKGYNHHVSNLGGWWGSSIYKVVWSIGLIFFLDQATFLSSLLQCLWTPNFTEWWFALSGSNSLVMWSSQITWQTKTINKIIFTTTTSMSTKKSSDYLAMWFWEIRCRTKTITSPPPQFLWWPNMEGW